MANKLEEVFGVKKPIIGMIHLGGNSINEKIGRAIDELNIYRDTGLDGAVIENYFTRDKNDVRSVLQEVSKGKYNGLKLGINILGDFGLSFALAKGYSIPFIQVDSVQSVDLNSNIDRFTSLRIAYNNIFVMGGVRFKVSMGMQSDRSLEHDIIEGIGRCHAIVTTGDSTGEETPTQKLKDFRQILDEGASNPNTKNFPLGIGSGFNVKNAKEQLQYADFAIVGSSLKHYGHAEEPVDYKRCDELMKEVRKIRTEL